MLNIFVRRVLSRFILCFNFYKLASLQLSNLSGRGWFSAKKSLPLTVDRFSMKDSLSEKPLRTLGVGKKSFIERKLRRD